MRFILFMFVVTSVIAPPAVLSAQPGSSSLVRSNFGFEISLPSGWVQLGPRQASERVPRAEELGLEKANQKDLELYYGRVKNGKVEFYLDAHLSNDTFTNNISLQLENDANDYSRYTPGEIRSFCAELPADLSKTWSEPVSVKGCEVVSSNGSAVLAYSYIVPTQEKFILQYVIPFNEKQTMLLVGGGRLNKDVIARMQVAIRAIAVGITGRPK